MSVQMSVIMAVKDEMAHLPAAIESILNQSFAHFELIVVDDASTDGTYDYLKSINDPRLRVLKNSGKGQTAGLNQALAAAQSDWIARMDGDDCSHPNRFDAQWKLASAQPDLALVTCDYMICDENLKEIAEIRIDPERPEKVFDYLKNRNNPFCHPTILFKKSAAPGGYDERLKNAQDMDLYGKLLAHGKWGHVSKALLKYRVRKQSLSILRHPEQERERQMSLSGTAGQAPAPAIYSGKRVVEGLYAYKLGFAAWLAGKPSLALHYLTRSLFKGVRPLRSLVLMLIMLFPRPIYLRACGYKGVYR